MRASTSLVFAPGCRCCTLTEALLWPSHASCTGYRSSWNIWTCSFEIYGKWSVQTSIDRYTHVTHTHVLNGIILVWSSLRLAPITIISVRSYMYGYHSISLNRCHPQQSPPSNSSRTIDGSKLNKHSIWRVATASKCSKRTHCKYFVTTVTDPVLVLYDSFSMADRLRGCTVVFCELFCIHGIKGCEITCVTHFSMYHTPHLSQVIKIEPAKFTCGKLFVLLRNIIPMILQHVQTVFEGSNMSLLL